jgi:DNA processing protein
MIFARFFKMIYRHMININIYEGRMKLNKHINEKDWMLLFNQTNGIGAVTMKKIHEYFGSFTDASDATILDFRHLGLSNSVIDKLHANINKSTDIINKIYEDNRKHNVKVITIIDERYPKLLAEIYDAPFILYVKGDETLLNEYSISVVGTREPSYYGKWAAKGLGQFMADNQVPVVSGLAKGIDKFVHEGVLSRNGKCIGVVATGLAEIYPVENKYLYENIIESGGCIISEYSLYTKARQGHFPARNRIISGLSLATIVVESKQKGGALITADQALEQNRDVFAMPGNINSPNSEGTNNLIKQGAKVLIKWENIFEEIQVFHHKINNSILNEIENDIINEEKELLELIPFQEIHIDLLQTKYDHPDLFVNLLKLQLKNYIVSLPGQYYVRLR